jgi:hypothetical protein
MVLALLAPELIITWAMRQLILASEVAKENKSGIYCIIGGRT